MSDYTRPSFLFNAHLETIYPAVFRKVTSPPYHRERITTPDNDFLDLDWIRHDSKKLVILSHGLEGNTSRAYILGMAKVFSERGYDVLAWNYRGCSEEMNTQLQFYHSGATDDLNTVVQHAIKNNYSEINLIGFSLGGNLTLKYLGEEGNQLNTAIRKAVTFSVPLNLYTSCLQISKPANWIYSNRFLNSLKTKIKKKAAIQNQLSTSGIEKIKSLIEFDDAYTAPIHGFKNAIDYYTKCSSINFLDTIKVQTLIVNAANDPFLSKDCYLTEIKNHSFVKFESPKYGGHVGFSLFNQNGLYWSELRALNFITP